MEKSLFDELQKRGLIAKHTPKLPELLKTKTTLYIGFDPTADSLHLGHLLPLTIARRALNFGHKIIFILGGGTALIGDPSGKNKERPIIPEEKIKENIKSISAQIGKFMTIDDKKLKLVNNAIWLKKLSLLEFLREVGKEAGINSMLDLEIVRKRLDKHEFMSFAEFTYQLIQTYDFYVLFTKYNCRVQYGGTDQWGNIVQGIQFIKKKTGSQVHGFAFPLITDPATGKKFGKTEKGKAVWLNPEKTPPFHFYQFLLNTSDALAEKLIFYYSFLSIDKIKDLINKHRKQPEKRLLQQQIADEITEIVHGKKAVQTIKNLNNILFTSPENLEKIPPTELKRVFPLKKIEKELPLSSLVMISGLADSKKEAERLIKQNAIKLFTTTNYKIIKKGKKNFSIVAI